MLLLALGFNYSLKETLNLAGHTNFGFLCVFLPLSKNYNFLAEKPTFHCYFDKQ